MSCTKSFQLNAKEDDTPLDQAIYSGANDAIFAVRGQWIYRFNATTGKKETEFMYANGVLGESSIVEVGGSLYVGFWRNVLFDNTSSPLPQDIYRINYALNTTTPLGMDIAHGNYSTQTVQVGFSNLVTDGTLIYGSDRYQGIFSVDPTNIAIYEQRTNFPFDPFNPIYDLAYDSDRNMLAAASWGDPNMWALASPFGNFGSYAFNSGADMTQISGITIYPGSNVAATKGYAVRGTNEIYKGDIGDASANFTQSSLFVLEAAAKPVRIKYNAQDGKIFVPTWSHNTVEILDPTTDTITAVKTGFSCPFDVVFTPTKAFAVQNASKGLQEII